MSIIRNTIGTLCLIFGFILFPLISNFLCMAYTNDSTYSWIDIGIIFTIGIILLIIGISIFRVNKNSREQINTTQKIFNILGGGFAIIGTITALLSLFINSICIIIGELTFLIAIILESINLLDSLFGSFIAGIMTIIVRLFTCKFAWIVFAYFFFLSKNTPWYDDIKIPACIALLKMIIEYKDNGKYSFIL